MQAGDRITLEMPYGRFLYRVQRTAAVNPDDVGVVKPVGYERLVLSACNAPLQRRTALHRLRAADREWPAAGVAGT